MEWSSRLTDTTPRPIGLISSLIMSFVRRLPKLHFDLEEWMEVWGRSGENGALEDVWEII